MKKLLKLLFSLSLVLCISSSLLIKNTKALENDLTTNSICLEDDLGLNESGFTIGYSYSDNDTCLNFSENFNAQPLAAIVCPNSPEYNKYHQMMPKGIGVLYRYNPTTGAKTLVFKNGAAYQCPHCHYVIVVQEATVNTLGYYASWNPGESVSGTGVVLSASNIYYASGNTIPGCKFY